MFKGYSSELLQRPERFVVSGPILIATAIGAASVATAGVTAHYITKEETNRIVEEVKIHREEDLDNGIHNNMLNFNISAAIAKDLDNIRYASTLSALNVNELYQATSTNNEVKHLFSKATVFSFSDPSTEQWFTDIEDMVSNNTGHLTKSESKEVTRLSAELTNMVTTLVPLSNISHKCEDKLLLKTMITPHINYRARMEVEMVDGRLQYKYKNDSTYILISQDAVLSQSTKMFNQDIHVIGRTCTIHKSINSTSSSTGNALFENFHFTFEGNLTMTETCPFNGSTVSSQWTFFSTADIRLPLVCSINSPKINYNSVSLHTSQISSILVIVFPSNTIWYL